MAKLRGQGQLEPVGPLVTLEHESQLGRGKPLLVVEKFPPAERAREIRSFPATAEGVTPDVRAPPSQSGGRRVPPLPRWRHSWDRKELIDFALTLPPTWRRDCPVECSRPFLRSLVRRDGVTPVGPHLSRFLSS